MKDFVHLHVHSEYSLLDGACRIKELVSAVKNLGQSAVAVTDHGVMYGIIDFYKEAKAQGIKPIIGCEVYVAKRHAIDKIHGIDNEYSHLVLLCENETGYQNLIKLVSAGFVEGFYSKPRIDHDMLEKNHEGLIALSACLSGEIPKYLLYGDFDKARETAKWYESVFGKGNYYIEIQNHGLEDQQVVLPRLIKLAGDLSIPLVATNDVHYITKEDSALQKILICIQTGKTVDDPDGMEFGSDEFYLKSGDEMARLFSAAEEACENTVKIAERCNVEFEFGKTKLPHFEVAGNHFEYLTGMCKKGLCELYGNNHDAKLDERLEYELNTIEQMGYTDYYLIVYDFIHYAKSNGIPVGPGRGSGAGSLAAYCIGITEIDPIKYNLIFERFLNPERVSMPDFDVDFCYVRREEVIKYLVDKYGSDHVAQIVTFGTLAARAAIRDVGRALNLPYASVDSVAKKVPNRLKITLDEALKGSPELVEMYNSDENVHKLIDMAKRAEGMPRHASTHAAGVVITRDPVDCYVPLAKSDDAVVTQFTMTALEELGLLKIDLLGLRTLTVIDDAVKMIASSVENFSINSIPLDDKAVFEMLSSGLTEGVFQLESAGMKTVLQRLKPESIEDIIAVISLYRPGPMESISKYIENRHNPEKISYPTDLLKPILDVTYGCLVYQEQVMQVFRELAGYSYGRADVVRRAMAKKKHAVMEKERASFIEGCGKNNISSSDANLMFDNMTSFASYAFNKSHAASYAVVAYRTAWLKCHYPAEFMAALLSSVLESSDKVSRYISECSRLSIPVLPPDVNYSQKGFTARNGKVVFGLLAIKNLGISLIESIIKNRTLKGNYTSFVDFCKRIKGRDFNRRGLESLIKSGSLDELHPSRSAMLAASESLLNLISNDSRNNIEGQIGMFDDVTDSSEYFVMPRVAEMDESEKLALEKETTGIYISGHPASRFEPLYSRFALSKISDITSDDTVASMDGKTVSILGILLTLRLKTTKSNSTMAYVTLEDTSGTIEILVFPKVLKEFSPFLKEGGCLAVSGRLSYREERGMQLIAERFSSAENFNGFSVPEKTNFSANSGNNYNNNEASAHKSKYYGLHLHLDSENQPDYKKICAILEIFDGNTPVYMKFDSTGKRVLVPRRLWVTLNEAMVSELKNILGDSNVAVLE